MKSAISAFLFAMTTAQSAYAGTAALNLSIGGSITDTPVWVVDGTEVTSGYLVNYVFNNVPIGGILTSATHNLYLQNSNPSPSINLVLTLPSVCTVGVQSVAINFIENGNIITADGSLSAHFTDFTSGSGTSTAMQLTGVSNASGNVNCASAGNLTYTY